MTEQEIFSKNLILSTEFDRYILEHPEVAEKIPLNAQIVFLPEDDPELCTINLEIADRQREEGQHKERRQVFVSGLFAGVLCSRLQMGEAQNLIMFSYLATW